MHSADSPGPSISSAKPLLIFDLDGTILTINSFPHWVKFMLFGKFAHLTRSKRLRLFFHTAMILVLRKLLRHNHGVTKQRLQKLWALNADQDTLNAFITSLLKHIRPNMKIVLEAVKQGDMDAILATSAAGVYAKTLGETLGFKHILATDTQENYKERKCERTLALIKEQGWQNRKRVFFTDHEEDMPLIRACNRTLWFGDDNKTDAPIIPCVRVSAAEIMQLISA